MGNSSSEEEAEAAYKDSLVNFALQKLSDEERGLISLYYYEELNTEEISCITGISKSNIKATRALLALPSGSNFAPFPVFPRTSIY